jgi:hypothetical protein
MATPVLRRQGQVDQRLHGGLALMLCVSAKKHMIMARPPPYLGTEQELLVIPLVHDCPAGWTPTDAPLADADDAPRSPARSGQGADGASHPLHPQ